MHDQILFEIETHNTEAANVQLGQVSVGASQASFLR